MWTLQNATDGPPLLIVISLRFRIASVLYLQVPHFRGNNFGDESLSLGTNVILIDISSVIWYEISLYGDAVIFDQTVDDKPPTL